ncbi:MAG: hypothetical protein U0U70_00230 [Chitinophagaceae bacterium]
MLHVFFIHWNEKELKEKIAPLKKAGYRVSWHFSQESTASLKDDLPDVLIICLDRLPSHGRAYAEWMWGAKKRQHIPVIFCGGQEDKVKATRARFPQAIFCSNEQVADKLKALNTKKA